MQELHSLCKNLSLKAMQELHSRLRNSCMAFTNSLSLSIWYTLAKKQVFRCTNDQIIEAFLACGFQPLPSTKKDFQNEGYTPTSWNSQSATSYAVHCNQWEANHQSNSEHKRPFIMARMYTKQKQKCSWDILSSTTRYGKSKSGDEAVQLIFKHAQKNGSVSLANTL